MKKEELLRKMGERLAKARKLAGYSSQESLAVKMGCHFITISRWENGKAAMSVEELYKIAKILGVTTDWLMGLSDIGPDIRSSKSKNDKDDLQILVDQFVNSYKKMKESDEV